MRRFRGRVCLVTGAASGIGRATSMRLAAEGGSVMLLDINQEGGHQTAAMIASASGQSVFVQTDVSNGASVRAAVDRAVGMWERIDILVNNAALMTFDPVVRLQEQDWDRVMAVNLRSVFLLAKYCVPHMRNGAIVNVSSVHAHETTANVVPYATSKGGLEAFTRALSRECETIRVRVNCVDPGAVDTPMLWSNPNVKSGTEKIEGAIGTPEDIAAAICFLASDEARFINGTSLAVDGGRLSIL